MTNKTWTLFVAGLLILLAIFTLVLYWPGLSGPFLLDDVQNIIAIYIESPGLDGIIYTLTHNDSGVLGRSVSMLSFVLSGLQYGLNPWGYKLHNLIVHILCGGLLFRVSQLLVPHLLQKDAADPIDTQESKNATLIALFLSALWLLHPLQVSTVLYVVQRMAQLSTLFTLLALYSYLRSRTMTMGRNQFTLLLHAWILFPCWMMLSILSKENGVLIPLYVLLIEIFAFNRGRPYFRNMDFHLRLWLGVFVLVPLLAGGLYVLTHFPELTDYSNRSFTLEQRLLTQVAVVLFYARMIMLPRLSEMSLYHDDFPLTQSWSLEAVLHIAFLLAVFVVMVFLFKRSRLASFGIAWFLVSHLLESTFIPLELVFEHRNYLASAGLLLIVAWAFALPRQKNMRATIALVAAVLAIFSLQTAARNKEWSNIEVFLTIAVNDQPLSQRAHTEYANFLANQGKLPEAIEQLEIAYAVEPEDTGSLLHKIIYQCQVGIRDEAALAEAVEQLSSIPVSIYALNSLKNLLKVLISGDCKELTITDASDLLDAALREPRNQMNKTILGYLKGIKGEQYFISGRYAQGVIEFREAYDLVRLTVMLSDLVRYQIDLGRLDDAADTLSFLEAENERKLGIDNYIVRELQDGLAAARSQVQETTPGN